MSPPQQYYSRDICPGCGEGQMAVYFSTIVETTAEPMRKQYLRCNSCGHRPAGNKVIFPARFAPFRRARGRRLRCARGRRGTA